MHNKLGLTIIELKPCINFFENSMKPDKDTIEKKCRSRSVGVFSVHDNS